MRIFSLILLILSLLERSRINNIKWYIKRVKAWSHPICFMTLINNTRREYRSLKRHGEKIPLTFKMFYFITIFLEESDGNKIHYPQFDW